MRESIIVRVSFDMCAFYKRSEVYYVGCSACTICRRKKFTFAISSPDEFLVSVCRPMSTCMSEIW